MKKIPNSKIIEVYASKAANLSATAKALNVDRKTLYKRRQESAELDSQMTDVEESLLDFTESKLMQQIDASNLTAIIFYLKTKGRRRGYIERQENEFSMHPFLQLMQDQMDE